MWTHGLAAHLMKACKMSIEKLDHYSIRTADVPRAIRFYEQALGLACGPRPPFLFPGAWLYPLSDEGEPVGAALVHLIGKGPDGGGALADYLGEDSAAIGSDTGALDHVALTANDIASFHARLAQHGIPFRERSVPLLNLHQVFVKDPDGVTIELNFSRADDIEAGRVSMASSPA